jgi:hypothetical protein
MGKRVKQEDREGHDPRDDPEPQKHERPLVCSRGRSGDAEDQRESSEYLGQEVDHESIMVRGKAYHRP